jgi:hypothetical protein
MTRTSHSVTKQVEAEFAKAMEHHVATVLLDSGTHRHIRCAQPGTFNRHFHVTTWPGYLAITGDMGSFVFARLEDMFQFFRRPDGRVNYSYWAEKLTATERDGGHKQFCEAAFREYIEERITEWLDYHDLEDRAAEVREAVADEVLNRAHDGMERAVDAARSFTFEGERPFEEAWDNSFTEESYYFAWCCHAIVWAINQYDAMKLAGGVA